MTFDPAASNEPPLHPAGATLREGRYRLRQKLGQGGMGSVYLAEDTLLPGRLVAIKENLAASDDAQGQFKREALLLARLRHPNLPQVMDYFIETDGKQYLVMDYVPGENLAQILKQRQGPLPVSEALAIVEQVMLALVYMHTWRDPDSGKLRPIIHRDIKPANIKRTPEGRVVLVDFGIAKMDSGTMTGTALSAKALTPGYAPLEQYGGGTDARSDIYSLGATLFALLAGKAPPSATDMAMAGSKQKAPLMSALKSAPPAVVKVIERAMQSMPEARYQSMAEMYQALYNRPLPAGGGVHMAAAQPGPAGKRGRWTAAATAVGALLLVGAGWLLATQFAGVPPTEPTAVVPVDTPTAQALAIVTVLESPAPALTSTENSPTPTAVTPEPTVTNADTPVPTATETMTPESTVTNTATPVATATETMTPEPTVTNTATPVPTATETATAEPTVTNSATPVPTATETMTPEPTVTNTATPVSTATETATPDATATAIEQDVLRRVAATLTAQAPTATSAASPVAATRTPLPTHTPLPTVVLASRDSEILIPAGAFLMGCSSNDSQCSDDERPQHTVTLDAYYIDKYEVTNARYQTCVVSDACSPPKDANSFTQELYYGNTAYADYPVINVTWQQAEAYCAWAGKRLPTEAEWEKAARGTDGRTFPWGNGFNGAWLNFCDVNCDRPWRYTTYDDGYAYIAPVGSYPDGASPYGALDMTGNVWEWTADWYDEHYYSVSPESNPPGPSAGSWRVLRGGSWGDSNSNARTADRGGDTLGYWDYDLGFRCVRPQ